MRDYPFLRDHLSVLINHFLKPAELARPLILTSIRSPPEIHSVVELHGNNQPGHTMQAEIFKGFIFQEFRWYRLNS